MTTQSDGELVILAQNGDKAAFDTLIGRQESHIRKNVIRYVSFDDVEDIMQEVSVKAWRNLKGINDPDNFRVWITRIAHNEAVDHLRQTIRRRRYITHDALDQENANEPNTASPEIELETKEEIRIAFDKLQEQVSKKVYLCYLLKSYGYTFGEIAEILGIEEGSAKAYNSTARTRMEKIRAQMREEQKGEL